jgi:hypothetical protein
MLARKNRAFELCPQQPPVALKREAIFGQERTFISRSELLTSIHITSMNMTQINCMD